MFYKWKVRFLKNRPGNYLWRQWHSLFGKDVGIKASNRASLPEFIRKYAPGHSFVDVGCMWNIHGEYTFLAEEVGATVVKGVDVFGPTPEFEATKHERNSSVEFILGDATHRDTIARVGVMDVVFCAGVLYHHPSPFDLLVALRQMCGKTLILHTAGIPEVNGLPHAAVYWPMLGPKDRDFWNLQGLGSGGQQTGITTEFLPEDGYGNWFWGMSPSCVKALLQNAGFRIDYSPMSSFFHTFICTPVNVPFEHRLPDELEAHKRASSFSSVS
jgi:hypothetical protein